MPAVQNLEPATAATPFAARANVAIAELKEARKAQKLLGKQQVASVAFASSDPVAVHMHGGQLASSKAPRRVNLLSIGQGTAPLEQGPIKGPIMYDVCGA